MPAVSGARGARVSRATSTILRGQPFLDSTGLTLSGLTLGVNRPSKQGNVWDTLAIPSDGTKPDWGVGYVSVHQVNDVTKIFTTCFDSPSINTVHHGYVTTTDGSTMTRPNNGLVTFAGNTNNALITPGSFTRNQFRTTWDDYSKRYVCIVTTGVGTLSLYQAASMPGAWGASVKDLTAASFGKTYMEPMAFWRRSDNRAVIYYQDIQSGTADYGSIRRHVGMLLGPSDGSLTGTWTDSGRVLSAASGNAQLYYSGAWVDGDLVYVPVGIFDGDASGPPSGHSISGTINRIHKVSLYTARANSGTTLTLADADWLSSTGVGGEYDGGEVIGCNNVARASNTWRYYFGGDDDTHHQTPELRRAMGYCTLGYRRIGKATGTGYVIDTTTVSAPQGGTLTVNGTGITSVELLNPVSGSALSGYAAANCMSIGSDVYDVPVSWNGSTGLPTSFLVKINVSGGAANHYEVKS